MLTKFIENSGFKIIAELNLTSCEYSIFFYLLNTVVSGFPQILTTEEELAVALNRSESEIAGAIDHLSTKQMLKVKYRDKGKSQADKLSMILSINFDLGKWQTPSLDKSENDARIYPFRKGRFQSIKGGNIRIEDIAEHETIERVLKTFTKGRHLDDHEVVEASAIASQLVENHPVDQIILILRHFDLRIPTLSLLASNWQHFQELYIQETQNIDMMEARQKHLEMDSLLKERIEFFLQTREISDEEKNILEILKNHRHPRRQLFWAFQSRSRYPGLGDFFTENSGLMLGITSTGSIVKNKN